jgi:hypothetical protein
MAPQAAARQGGERARRQDAGKMSQSGRPKTAEHYQLLSRASRANPPQTRPRALNPCAAVRAPPEPVHTHQPLAGVCSRPAPHRATPRRARKSRAEPQAHQEMRRTFHEPRRPPETDAERAWQGRAIQTPAPTHPRTHAATPRKGRLSPAPAAPSPPPPGASPPRYSAAARATREPVHTRQPLAGGLHPSAPRRPTPRRDRKSRAAPQACPGTRRTFRTTRNRRGARRLERSYLDREIDSPS